MSVAKILYQVLALVLVVVVIVVVDSENLLSGSGSQVDRTAPATVKRKRPTPAVVVRKVRFESDAAVIQAVGTGKALKAVDLFPEAEGRVVQVLFKSGQKVKAGAPLIRLEDESETLALRLAKITFENAKVQLKRYERIASGQAITLNRMEEARKAFAIAQIQLSQATLALRRRTLKAPFDGIVGIPKVQVGDSVTKTTQVTHLDDRSSLLVEFEIPASLAFGVRRGGKFTATTWARRRDRHEGVVIDLGSRVDATTRTLLVRGRIANRQDQLRSGLAFSITLPLAGRDFPSVPSVAIR